uniref:Uncharacterized protein n=1 Tax=Magallana gigas TaxID=29159 RepID=A0A8W8LM82_MAGGI
MVFHMTLWLSAPHQCLKYVQMKMTFCAYQTVTAPASQIHGSVTASPTVTEMWMSRDVLQSSAIRTSSHATTAAYHRHSYVTETWIATTAKTRPLAQYSKLDLMNRSST